MSHAKTDKEFAKLSAYDALRDAYRKDWSSTDATRLREILNMQCQECRTKVPVGQLTRARGSDGLIGLICDSCLPKITKHQKGDMKEWNKQAAPSPQ